MNKVILSGNISTEINYATSKNGKAYCRFNLATTSNYKDTNGNLHCDFVDCVAYGKTAEYLNSYGSKGQKATVFGSLQVNSYKDNDGKTHKSIAVNVGEIELVKGSGSGNAKAAENDTAIDLTPISDDALPF